MLRILLEPAAMKLKYLVITVLLFGHSAGAEEVPGQNLLSYFSANCRTEGEWTRAAIADSSALIEALRSIQSDPDCKSVGGAISQLGLLNQQLSSLQNISQTQSQIAQLNAQEQELLVQLSGTTNAVTVDSINAKLRDLQVTRAGLVGRDSARNELATPDKAVALGQIVQIANSTFGQVAGNQKCLSRHPNVLNTATSVMSAIGATATLVNPALGLGLTAGSELLGKTIEGVRATYNNRAIRRISDNTIASEAYKCALETMSNRWCQMRDAEAFLLFKAEQRRFAQIDKGLTTAIRMNDREIPVILDWLNKIRSGVTPTSTADSGRQNAVRERDSYVQSREAFGLGLISESKELYNNQTTDNERWNIIRSLIKSLVPQVNENWRNPLFDAIGSAGYAPFFLLGLNDDEAIKNPATGGYHTLDTWKKPAAFNPSLENLRTNYTQWIAITRARVSQELSQVLQPDPLQTLSLAFDRTGNRWKISPMDGLKNVIEFLETNPPREADIAFRKLFNDTIKKLKAIYNITYDTIIVQQISDTKPVEQIYTEAQLSYGTVVLEARLDMIVRLAVLELLETSKPEDQVLVAQLLAAERFTDTLARMSGTDNLAMIRADINRAQPITIANLNSFIDLFGNNIARILARLKWEEENSSGTVAKNKRYARTEMCFLLLAVPAVDRYIDSRLCEGLQLKSLIKDGPESIVITTGSFTTDLNERACEYREFFRKSKIFETWGIK